MQTKELGKDHPTLEFYQLVTLEVKRDKDGEIFVIILDYLLLLDTVNPGIFEKVPFLGSRPLVKHVALTGEANKYLHWGG